MSQERAGLSNRYLDWSVIDHAAATIRPALVLGGLVLWILVGCGRTPIPDQPSPDLSASSSAAAASGAEGDAERTVAKKTDAEKTDAAETSAPPAVSDSEPGDGVPKDLVTLDKATPEQLREAALQALGQGQDDLAFDLVRQVMRVDDSPQAVFLHALVLGDRYRFHEAIKMLDDLAARAPATRLPALGQTAEWLVLAGECDEAESRYREILKQAPETPMVHRHLAHLLLQMGKRTDAALHLRFLAQLGEISQEELVALLSLSKPLRRDQTSRALDPLNRLARARNQWAIDDPEAALQTLESGGDLNGPESALRARILAVRGEIDSVRSWAQTSAPDANDPDGWFARGLLAAKDGKHDEAIRCFSKTLLIDYTDADAYQHFSESLTAVGNESVATEAAQRADLIRKSQQIGLNLMDEATANRSQIAELLTILQQLNRPLEFFAWQGVNLVHAANEGAISEQQAEAAFLTIGPQREELVKAGRHVPDAGFILCGLDIDLDEAK